MTEKFIQKALSDKGDKGRLHRALKIPEGKKIPKKTLEKAESKPGKIGKMARFAETLSKLRKK